MNGITARSVSLSHQALVLIAAAFRIERKAVDSSAGPIATTTTPINKRDSAMSGMLPDASTAPKTKIIAAAKPANASNIPSTAMIRSNCHGGVVMVPEIAETEEMATATAATGVRSESEPKIERT